MFKVDLVHGTPATWHVGGTKTLHPSYTPTLYIAAEKQDLIDLRPQLAQLDQTETTVFEQWKRSWQHQPEAVLRVDVDSIDAVQDLGYRVRSRHQPTQYRLYNIDLSPQFRYCLETDTDPNPQHELSTLRLESTQHRLTSNDLSVLQIDGDRYDGSEREIIETIQEKLQRQDPDVIIVSHSQLLLLLKQKAQQYGCSSFQLGREPGLVELAGESTYTQYGQRHHSPARYDIPGRAIINRSNSFFMTEAGLHGILDLVQRSHRPLQETAWSSIGSVLTAIQITHAMDNNVLIPWNPRRPEQPKSLRTLHNADRGGFIFSPKTGIYYDIHQVDFASLYPNIICTRNISPDTIRCDCHHSDDVPEIGYSICEQDGFLPDVLQPIIDDRQAYKQQIRKATDETHRQQYQEMSDALKWILVSCFGYQGFANAKFGRIECHEAINAYAREIMLQTKELFENHGWQILHGIIDSIWVEEQDNATAINRICTIATKQTRIELEHEHRFKWIAFCPRSSTYGGALNRYFGITADDDLVIKGIECRQRSTPSFIAERQRQYIRMLNRHETVEPIINAVQQDIRRLKQHNVPVKELIVTRRTSQPINSYTQHLKNASAMKRAQDLFDINIQAGMDTQYIVVDDTADGMDRIQLPHEQVDQYDTNYYTKQLKRAAKSVLTPLEVDETDIESAISKQTSAPVSAYLSP